MNNHPEITVDWVCPKCNFDGKPCSNWGEHWIHEATVRRERVLKLFREELAKDGDTERAVVRVVSSERDRTLGESREAWARAIKYEYDAQLRYAVNSQAQYR